MVLEKTAPVNSLWTGNRLSDNDYSMKENPPRAAVCLAALFLASTLLFAQQAPASSFSPFPTYLRAAMKDGKVELSWLDSPDVKGGYVVYRHSEPPSQANLSAAVRLGTVERGSQSFVDLPPDDAPYYYFVFALADDGSPYEAFVPGNNATASPISLKPAAGLVAEAPKPKEEAPLVVAPAPTIENLAATPRGDGIVLSFKAEAGKRLVLYRGTAPIAGASDLLDASLVATFVDKDGIFIDYPVPGIEYWYAILVEDDLKSGRIELTKGRNTTTEAARIAVTERNEKMAVSSPTSRTPPLPVFLLDEATGTALPSAPVEAPARQEISSETEKALGGSILAIAVPIERPLPSLHLLSEELSAPSGGEDYALSLIVTEKLIKRDWAEAIDQLHKYLSLNRSTDASARARFYLGQALAYSGAYRDSFFEFLSARARYPKESAPWIDYVLASLR